MKGYEWKDLWAVMDAYPENWQPTTKGMTLEMLGALPPAAMKTGSSLAFLVGEPRTHNDDGFPVYACFREVGGKYEAKHMTLEEFNEL